MADFLPVKEKHVPSDWIRSLSLVFSSVKSLLMPISLFSKFWIKESLLMSLLMVSKKEFEQGSLDTRRGVREGVPLTGVSIASRNSRKESSFSSSPSVSS